VLSRQGCGASRFKNSLFRILALLLQRPGEIVTREELQRSLWPEGTHVNFERQPECRPEENCVRPFKMMPRIRALSKPFPAQGYRFLAPVHSINGFCELPCFPRQAFLQGVPKSPSEVRMAPQSGILPPRGLPSFPEKGKWRRRAAPVDRFQPFLSWRDCFWFLAALFSSSIPSLVPACST